jgi:hypothetical protein
LLDQAEHRARIGRTAAQPGCDGQVLFKRNVEALRARKCSHRAHHEVVERIVERLREFSDGCQIVSLGRRCDQSVSRIDKGEQRLKFVIAVLAPPADVQREVDLGVGCFGEGQRFARSWYR